MPESVFVVARAQFKSAYEFPPWIEIKPKLSLTRNLAFYPAHRKVSFGSRSTRSHLCYHCLL